MATETIKIYSENNDFQHVETLKRNREKRSKNKQFFVEGVQAINSVLENQWEIDTFLYSKEKNLSNWATDILDASKAKKHIELPIGLMEKLSDKEYSSELIAIVAMQEDNLDGIRLKKDLFVVLIDRASNPGNLGTIIRSCNSFGVDAVIMTGHCVDVYDPKTIQASLGTLFATPVIRLESTKELMPWMERVTKEIGKFSVIGTTAKTDTTIETVDIKTPLMLVIGNETHGLSSKHKEMCDTFVAIPMRGSVSSLNVACATSIFLYEIQRLRRLGH